VTGATRLPYDTEIITTAATTINAETSFSTKS
ncbi:uncharacterized protein METZ01_LOCUS492988, partial [marine metagenome]